MTRDEVIAALKQIIVSELDVNLKESDIGDGSAFFENGLGIDSIAIVGLISLTEQRFGIEFREDDLVPESFRNLQSLTDLILRRL